jgi:hypothetical protein
MRRLNFDVTEEGRREERKGRRERLDQHLDRHIDDEDAREEARQLIDALVSACLPEPEGGMSQDMSPDAVAARIVDPARSQLNSLTRGVPNPSRYVR